MAGHGDRRGIAITLDSYGIAIPATLDPTRTARSVAQHLPLSTTLRRYESDYCAPMRTLPTSPSETIHLSVDLA